MRTFKHLVISLVAVTAVNARPQDENPQPTTPTTDSVNNLPGFCPSAVLQDPDTHGQGSGDCRCGQSLGLQVSDAETNAVQPLAAAPDWQHGGNCGCQWEQGQCGCYDGVSGGDGWLYGGFGGGEGGDNRCTVTVSVPVPFPVPEPTVPGECGNGDRYCTVTVTVSQPGQPVTVPGQPVPPVTVTVPGPGRPEPTTVTVPGPPVPVPAPSGPEQSRTTTVVGSSRPGQSGTARPTTGGFSATGGGGGSRTSSTSRPTIVTVNAAAVQTGVMALGAMFGGAAMLANI